MRDFVIIGIPKEIAEREKRVALVPETVAKLADLGLTVQIEKGVGTASNYPDQAYQKAGATIQDDRAELFSAADMLISIQTPPDKDLKKTFGRKHTYLLSLGLAE